MCALSGPLHGEQSYPLLLRMLLSAPPQKAVQNLGQKVYSLDATC